jgi:YD repeat-containing protein
MKKCILLGVLIHFCYFAHAQFGSDAYAPPSVVPQAPEVSSLLKFSETPVSYHTGVPNISIPIASISGRELSASVSLSYHAGGHRVTEESSWVGLGWSLSAGGQISRTVKGKVDDHYPRGFVYTDATVEAVRLACANGTSINGQNCTTLEHNESGYDYQPDDFNYSMMGLSGRFMFDQNRDTNNPQGHIIQFPDQKVIITPTFAPTIVENGVTDDRRRIISWDITDTNGTVYHFEEGNIFHKSDNTPFKRGGTSPEIVDDTGGIEVYYTETWDLTSVTTLSGDQITFTYNRPQVEIGTSGMFYAFNDYNCTLSDEQVSVTITAGGSLSYNPSESTVTYTGVERNYTELSKITTSQGYIELEKSTTQRQDAQFEKFPLSRIKVYSTATSPASLVQDVELIQDYLISTPSTKNEFIGSYNSHGIINNTVTSNQQSFLNKRLRLNEVKFHSVDPNSTSNDSYSYTFEYHATSLPHKRSTGQDHWGYYNGKDNNYTLIPDFEVTIPGYSNPIEFTFSPPQGSADKEVSPSHSIASVIKSITYPEGGKTTYTFESNRGLDSGQLEYFGGLRIKKIETNSSDIEKMRKEFEYEGGHILSKPIYYAVGVGNVHTMRSQSWQPLLTTQGSYVNYIEVKEIQSFEKKEGTLQNPILISKQNTTIRTYSPVTGNLNNWNEPYTQEWSAGQLTSVQLGEGTDKKQLQTFTQSVYSIPTVNTIEGWSPTQTWAINDPSLPFSLNNFNPDGCSATCTIDTYSIYPGRKIPYSERTTLYEGVKSMVTDKYTYHEGIPYHFNPTKIITIDSSKDTIEVRMKYPFEMNDTGLLSENKVNTVLLTEQIKDSVLLQAIKNEYDTVYGIHQKKYVKTARYQLPVPSNTGFGPTYAAPIATTGFEDRLVFHSYYANGNIQEVSQKDGTHVVYIWGYNQTSPVAKIENATFSEVSSYVANIQNLSNADNDRTIGSTGNEGALRTALNNLRTVPALGNAMITTYTYDPLIGVTSITDPRGNTIYYQYDGFNRLISVKDRDGNLVSENNYHYKN